MNNQKKFVRNVDHLVPFNSQVMIINDVQGSENGKCLILANTDGPPIHAHPNQEELISVQEGTLEVYYNKKWNTLKAGEFIHVPKNCAHTYRNRSKEKCIFEYLITPKGSFSSMMVTLENYQRIASLQAPKTLSPLSTWR